MSNLDFNRNNYCPPNGDIYPSPFCIDSSSIQGGIFSIIDQLDKVYQYDYQSDSVGIRRYADYQIFT